jgi:hypothetical protein
MAKPTKKSEGIEHFLRSINGGVDRRTMIDANLCAICASPVGELRDFRDLLSVKEYRISGMCQACQDKVFNPEKS